MYSNKKIDLVSLNASMNGFACRAAKIISGLLLAFIMGATTLSWCGDDRFNDCDVFNNSSSYDTLDNFWGNENESINNVSFLLAQADFNPASLLSLPLPDLDLISLPEPELLQLLVPLESASCSVGRPLERLHSTDRLGKNAQCVPIARMAGSAAGFEGEGDERSEGVDSGKRKRDDTGGATGQPAAKKARGGEKKYVCGIGGCVFKTAYINSLKVHQRKHTGEKPYVCDFEGCTYAARQADNLKKHQATHAGEKPFVCGIGECEFKAAYLGSMKRHQATHAGEKPFKCDFAGCDYKAGRSFNLKQHKEKHNKDRRFKCTVCGYEAKRKSNLESHRKLHGVGAGLSVGGHVVS